MTDCFLLSLYGIGTEFISQLLEAVEFGLEVLSRGTNVLQEQHVDEVGLLFELRCLLGLLIELLHELRYDVCMLVFQLLRVALEEDLHLIKSLLLGEEGSEVSCLVVCNLLDELDCL